MATLNEIDILVRFAAQQGDFEEGMGTVAEQIAEFEKNLKAANKEGEKFGDGVAKSAKAAEQQVDKLSHKMRTLIKDAKTFGVEYDKSLKQFRSLETGRFVSKANLQELQGMKQRVEQLGILKTKYAQVSTAAARAAAVSQGVFLAGAGIVGGIIAAANKYVTGAEEATEVTKAWTGATDDLKASGSRVGAVFAQEALPLLQKAAEVAAKAAAFVEAHPEIVQAALKTGVVLAALGAVGTAVSKGIKLVADLGYITASTNQLIAAKLQDSAANKQLAAAGKKGLGGAAGVAGKSLLGLGAGAVGGIAAFGAGIGAAGFGTAREVRARGGDELARTFQLLTQVFGRSIPIIGPLLAAGANLEQQFNRVGDAGKDAETGLRKAASVTVGGVRGSEHQAEIVSSFTAFSEQAVALEQQYEDDRLQIIKDAGAARQSASNSNFRAVQRINEGADRTIEKIRKDAMKTDVEAEVKFSEQRSKIVEDAGKDVRRIQERLQEDLRRMAMDHDRRMEDLAIARDALGIIQERRRFDEDRQEAIRAANQETAKRRRDIAQRLSDLSREHAASQTKRRADFEARIKEAEAQREIQLEQQKRSYSDQSSAISANAAKQLRALDEQHRAEQERNRNAFLQTVRDLDASLLGETQLKRQYYAMMLKDAEAFLAQYRSTLGSTGSKTSTTSISGSTGRTVKSGGSFLGNLFPNLFPSRQTGGYAPGGLTNLHSGEFVMNPRSTRAAENAIGGKLTQDRLIMALAGMNRSTITVHDSRRFSGEYTGEMRREVKRDTLALFDNIMEG